MPTIEYKCKLCGGPGTAHFPEDAPQEAVDKWFPMLCHNQCADRQRARRDSEETIISLCLRYAHSDKATKIKTRDSTKSLLDKVTLKYAKALAEIMGLPKYVWTEDFSELLLDRPERCGSILFNYREELRNSAK